MNNNLKRTIAGVVAPFVLAAGVAGALLRNKFAENDSSIMEEAMNALNSVNPIVNEISTNPEFKERVVNESNMDESIAKNVIKYSSKKISEANQETNSPAVSNTTEPSENVTQEDPKILNAVAHFDDLTRAEKDEIMNSLKGKPELTPAENDFVIKYIENQVKTYLKEDNPDLYYWYLTNRQGPLTREENDFVQDYIAKQAQKTNDDIMRDIPRDGSAFNYPEGGSDREVIEEQKKAEDAFEKEQAEKINNEAQASYDKLEEAISQFPKEGPVNETGTSEITKEFEKSEEAGKKLLEEINGGITDAPELNEEISQTKTM